MYTFSSKGKQGNGHLRMMESEEFQITPFRDDSFAVVDLDRETYSRDLGDGIIEVSDPLISPFRIGDRSTFRDPTVDDFICAYVGFFGVVGSIRQLACIEAYEVKEGAGRWSRLQHEVVTAAMTAEMGGTPLEVMQMAIHDTGHLIGSHRTEPWIPEYDHEGAVGEIFRRSGFVKELKTRGIIDNAGGMRGLNVAVDDITNLADLPDGFIHRPKTTGDLEVEGVQYVLRESGIWALDPSEAREIYCNVIRIQDSPEGDRIAFASEEAARLFTRLQIRCRTESWNEPVHVAIAMMLGLRDALVLTAGEDEYRYSPSDHLYSPEELWEDGVTSISERDPAVSGLTKILKVLAGQQRIVHLEINDRRPYDGPMLPKWMRMKSVDNSQDAVSFSPSGELSIKMPSPKTRRVDPLVRTPKGLVKISNIDSSIEEFRQRQSRFMAAPVEMVVDTSDSRLGLTKTERKAIETSLSAIFGRWPDALKREPMPDSDFEAQIRCANKAYRKLGRVCLLN